MIRLYLTILFIFSFNFTTADIIEVSTMEEVMNQLDKADHSTLAIFDVDMVLVQPSEPAFQMANMKRYSSVAKRIMQKVPSDKQMIFLSLMTISSEPVLIDERIPKFLQQLMERKIFAMALTANLTGEFSLIKNMEEWRIKILCQLGIDFSKTAPSQSKIVFRNLAPYRENFSTFQDGILFVNGNTVAKGDALLAYFKAINYYPSSVIFVDDRETNLISVEIALQGLNPPIKYIGIHFLGAQKYPSTIISESEFEAKWEEVASKALKF